MRNNSPGYLQHNRCQGAHQIGSHLTYRIVIAILILLVSISSAPSQELPDRVRHLLDQQFPTWHFEEYRKPVLPGYPESSIEIDSRARNVLECHLNLDSVPDYAIRICIMRDNSPLECFLAAVSGQSDYRIFCLQTTQPNGDNLLISGAGTELAVFGDLDSVVSAYGRPGKDPEYPSICFPTDCVNLTSIVASSYDVNFVFVDEQFYEICSGD